MNVVINAAYVPALHAEEYSSLLSESFRVIALSYPQHHFVFVCSLQFKQNQSEGNNVKFHVVKPNSTSVLRNKYWFDISVPRILKKYKADLFVTPVSCSMNTGVPQCLIMHLPDINNFPSVYSRLQALYYKKYTPEFIKKAAQVIALSASAKKNIATTYPAAINKIKTVLPVVSELYSPVTFDTAEAIKNKYTEGREFFLYGGSTHSSANLRNLLKAFSLFKKRQQTSMKLVIVSLAVPVNSSFVKSIATYKYRSDIIYTDNINEQEYASLLASAYTFVYPVLFNGFCLRMLQAVYSHVPVITSQSALANELTGTSSLFVDSFSQQDIADKMMRMYKDESLRNELISNAAIAAEAYKQQSPALRLWQNIAAAAMPSS